MELSLQKATAHKSCQSSFNQALGAGHFMGPPPQIKRAQIQDTRVQRSHLKKMNAEKAPYEEKLERYSKS